MHARGADRIATSGRTGWRCRGRPARVALIPRVRLSPSCPTRLRMTVKHRLTQVRLAVVAVVLVMPPPNPGWADSEPVLSRGVNITGWFRFPVSRYPAALAGYISNPALADLHSAGFNFVRLAIDPDVVAQPAERVVLIDAIRRIQRQGLIVVVSPHPRGWRLEADPAPLFAFWKGLAPALRPLDPAHTVPEVLNEPVFANDPAGWSALQHQVLGQIRQALPRATVVLTGQDWGSIKGLLALTPEADPNVLYSFHFYEPPELTSLAAYRPNLDRTALARLPFPVDSQTACAATAGATPDPATGDLIRYYCALGWTEQQVADQIAAAAAWAGAHRVHLLAGEFGASIALNPAARLAWLRTVRNALAAHGIAWALWGYDDVMGLAVARPPGLRPRLDPDVLSALGLLTRTLPPGATPLAHLAGHDIKP